MKYEFIEQYQSRFRVTSMCNVLNVSRSGYYAWKSRRPSKRQQINEELLGHIRRVHLKSRKLYGSPRIAAELNDEDISCGKNRVARIMKNHGIRAILRRPRRRRTTDSRHAYALAANLLIKRRQTKGIWAADITYVPTREGWLYVSAVMNLESRKIIGLSMGKHLCQDLTSAALKDALQTQKPPEGLIHHSDRGRQYASYAYQALLKDNGITPSMSRSGNCYDNAFMESFFGTLKTELVHGKIYQKRQDARLSIFEYVMMFYNRRRRHSALGYKSPVQYEILNQ